MTAHATPFDRDSLLSFLDQRGLHYQRIDHPPVFTCEDAERHLRGVGGLGTKNLFLRNKKGDIHLLVTVAESKQVDLKALGELLGLGRLSFGSAERLRVHLGLEPGSVTLFGLINDPGRLVRFIADRQVWGAPTLQCHPLVNTATLVVDHAAVAGFLDAVGRKPEVVDVPAVASPG